MKRLALLFAVAVALVRVGAAQVTTIPAASGASTPPATATVSTSGPVADPGGTSTYQFNNASGALTFNIAAGVSAYQRCYFQNPGKSGAITIQMPASNTAALNGTVGSSAGTLVSTGTTLDAICLVSYGANLWFVTSTVGLWTGN